MLLSQDQLGYRDHLENVIHQNKRSFFLVCDALRIIYENELWRETHVRFGDYCSDRLGFNGKVGMDWVCHARIVEELRHSCPGVILPATHSQSEELAPLGSEERKIVWETAVEESGGAQPSKRFLGAVRGRLDELVARSKELRGEGRAELIGRVKNEEFLAEEAAKESAEQSTKEKKASSLQRAAECLERVARLFKRSGLADDARVLQEIAARAKAGAEQRTEDVSSIV